MIIKEKATSAVHYPVEGVVLADYLASVGLTEGDVKVYATKEEWEASPEGAERLAKRQAVTAQRLTKKRVKSRVAEDIDPELASVQALAVVYMLWEAVDNTKIPASVKAAVNVYAEEMGLPRVV